MTFKLSQTQEISVSLKEKEGEYLYSIVIGFQLGTDKMLKLFNTEGI